MNYREGCIYIAANRTEVQCQCQCLDARYVDDSRTIMHPIKAGWKWSEASHRMEWSDEQEADDMANSTFTDRTARTIENIVNSCKKTLRCTIETCQDFADGRLPTLDTNIWMEGGKVLNTFFEKEMSTVIHKDSALSENSKMASLSHNVVRHMRNTSERLRIEESVAVVKKFAQRLKNSVFSKAQARRVIVSDLRGHEAARKRAEKSARGCT